MNRLTMSVLAFVFVACSDIQFGDKFLDNQPESSGATLDKMFSSHLFADKVLNTAYSFLPYGLPTADNDKLGGNVLESITDLQQSYRTNVMDGPNGLYYNGGLSSRSNSGSEAYHFGWETEYSAIRYAWIYIENVNKVPDIPQNVKKSRIAEAKMIIAIAYAEMLRYVGGVPLLKHSVQPNDEMKFPRNTFAETVDYIVSLLDEAKQDLPWKWTSTEDGRLTKAGAIALKLRVLCFAASPTFNSDKKWHPDSNEYTCYGNYDVNRWKRAKEAGEEFFAEKEKYGFYELVTPWENTHEARRLAFRKGFYNRGSSELLISTRKGYNVNTHSPFLSEIRYSGPTLNYINMFPWADGSDFPEDFNWEAPSKQPFFTIATDAIGEPTRDPRLYETAAVPGDKFLDGTFAPVYSNSQFYKGGTGFLQMKFVMHEESERVGLPVQWPYLRYSEVLLSYAEAINEYDGKPNDIAYQCITQIRNRVGLTKGINPNLNQKDFREALLRERALELGYEEIRWFDLIRWGKQADFTKTLYGLRTSANDVNNPTRFTFKKFELPVRHWAQKWDSKWYLSPIPHQEVNKGYGITQNPGW